jgi:very-short-patch-repair endonuclease
MPLNPLKGTLILPKMKSDRMSMFYGASPSVFHKAEVLRNSMTEAELALWEFLSKSKVMGLRFKAQHPIDRFIADFYCHSIKIVIEVDGGIHNSIDNQEYDIGRTLELEKFGIKLIRFKNEQILNDFDNVKKEIINYCNQRKAELQVPFRGFRGRKNNNN